jgi:hypothetical protein
MSRKNKVNPGQYTQAGRLSPDDAARERAKQDSPPASERSGSGQKAVPAGISNRESAAEEQEERQRFPAAQEDEQGEREATPTADTDNEQTSSKHGSRSSAQKAAESKYVTRPHPASEKVEGAFGRESGN